MKALKARRNRHGLSALPNGSFPSLEDEFLLSLSEQPSWSSTSPSFKSQQQQQPSASRSTNIRHQISKLNCILCIESSFGPSSAAMDSSVLTTAAPKSAGERRGVAEEDAAGQGDTSTTTEETATFDVVEQEDFVTKLFLMRKLPSVSKSNDNDNVNWIAYGDEANLKSDRVKPELAANDADSSSYYVTDDDSSESSGLPLESMSSAPDLKVNEDESDETRIGIRPFQVPRDDPFPTNKTFPHSEPVDNIVAIEDSREVTKDEMCFIMVDAKVNAYSLRAKEMLHAAGKQNGTPASPELDVAVHETREAVQKEYPDFSVMESLSSESSENGGEREEPNFVACTGERTSAASEERVEKMIFGMEKLNELSMEPNTPDDNYQTLEEREAPQADAITLPRSELLEDERPASSIVASADVHQEGEASLLTVSSQSCETCFGTTSSNAGYPSTSVQVVLQTLEMLNLERSANNFAVRTARPSPSKSVASSSPTLPCKPIRTVGADTNVGSDPVDSHGSPARSPMEAEFSSTDKSPGEHIKPCSSSELLMLPPPPPPPPPPPQPSPRSLTASESHSSSGSASSKIQSLISKFEPSSVHPSPIGPRARKISTPPSPAPTPPFASRSASRDSTHCGQSVRQSHLMRSALVRRNSKAASSASSGRDRLVQKTREVSRVRVCSASPSRSKRLSTLNPIQNGANDPTLHSFFWRSHPVAKPALAEYSGRSGRKVAIGPSLPEPVTTLCDYEEELKKKREVARREFEAANKPPWAR